MTKLEQILQDKKKAFKLKKESVKRADSVGLFPALKGKTVTTKAELNQDSENAIERTIVGNTYLWLDSHDDVHIPGIFSKSISESGSSVVHLHDHIFELTAQVGKNLSVYESSIEWSELGVDKAGSTTSLFMDTRIEKDLNSKIFSMYKNDMIQQHSVGMRYVNLFLAVNDPEQEEEYKIWNRYIDQIGNASKAIEQGYFWAVTEAKLIEISAVIRGSNSLTPTQEPKNFDFENFGELLESVKNDASSENILQLCNQFKALQQGEAVEKTLPEKAKPRQFYLSKLKN